MSGRRALVVVAAAAFVACAAVAGLDDFEIVNDARDAALRDAAVDVVDAVASNVDDAATCNAPVVPITTAAHLAAPITVDGVLDDWPCPAFVELDDASAAKVLRTPLDSAQIAVGWDDTGVYFACHVIDPNPEGTAVEPYENDACELYLGLAPPAPGDGEFDAADLHLIVDYANRAGFYLAGHDAPMPSGIVTAAKVTAVGFDIEMFIPAAVLTYTPAANLDRLFDMQLDDCQNGDAQAGTMWSYFNDAGDAGGCTEPTCDTLFWGQIHLAP